MYQIATFAILLFSIKSLEGANFFESVNARLYCYGDEQPGCNSSFPEAFPNMSLSYSKTTNATTFLYLFPRCNKTRKCNPDKPELLHKCGGRLPPNSNFDPSARNVFIIPGFVSGICNFAIFREIIYEYLKTEEYNVFGVDWMWGNIFDLQDARLNMYIVADQLATVVKYLKEDFGIQVNDIICLGHSYGAHLCSFLSNRELIGIIYGIDPSGVVQTQYDPLDTRLDPGDANCVVAIHSNGGQCLPGFFGVNFNVGDIDFWVNGGLYQPNCYIVVLQSFIKGDIIFAFFSLYPAACFHFQSLQYTKTSIVPKTCEYVGIKCESYEKFKAGQCRTCNSDGENCAIMGVYTCDCLTAGQNSTGNAEKNVRYYVNTKALCPYCDNRGININGKSCMIK